MYNYISSLPPGGVRVCIRLIIQFAFSLIIYTVIFAVIVYVANTFSVTYPGSIDSLGQSPIVKAPIFTEQMLITSIGLSIFVNFLIAVYYILRKILNVLNIR